MGHLTKVGYDNRNIHLTKLLVCLVLSVICLSAALLITISDPLILMIKHYLRVDYNTILHESMSKETDHVHISVYLFNITNAEQFISGEDEKLKVEEIGPFTYQENRTNENLEIDNEAGVMRFIPMHRVTFLPDESIGNPEDFTVTMPNIAMLAMGSSASDYGVLGTVPYNMLVTRLKSNATVTMNAYDYLWGYDEPLIRLGNQFLPGWISFNKLGILDRLYDESIPLRMEVSSRDEDKFMIKRVNGLGGIKERGFKNTDNGSDPCSSFADAYEGLLYPVHMSPSRPIKIYRNVLCQFLELDYSDTITTDFGAQALTYKISNKTYTNAPHNQCLCSKDTCRDGVSDLSPCFYGLPVSLSQAHFLGADPAIRDKIEGLSPNEDLHGSVFTIDSIMGMVLKTKFSIQLNVNVGDVRYNSKISKFADMYIPVVCLKIVQPKLPEEQISSLRFIHAYCPYIKLTIQAILILASVLFLSFVAKIYWNRIYSRRNGIGFQLQTKENILSNKPLIK